jgi:uncharacterized protein (DUF433 family)
MDVGSDYNEGSEERCAMRRPEFYIICDLNGAKRICDTRVSIDSVLACLDQGDDAATIQEAYPALTREQVDSTIQYISSHPREIEEHRRLQTARWETLRAESEAKPDALRDRVRKLRQGSAA